MKKFVPRVLFLIVLLFFNTHLSHSISDDFGKWEISYRISGDLNSDGIEDIVELIGPAKAEKQRSQLVMIHSLIVLNQDIL